MPLSKQTMTNSANINFKAKHIKGQPTPNPKKNLLEPLLIKLALIKHFVSYESKCWWVSQLEKIIYYGSALLKSKYDYLWVREFEKSRQAEGLIKLLR